MIRMLSTVTLATLGLLTLDVGTTAVAPVLATPSLTTSADAADFKPRVKRVRIRERKGDNYRIAAVGTSDPVATGGIADQKLQLMICGDSSCSDGVKLAIEQDQTTQVLRTGTFGFAGAMAPMGEYTFGTTLRDADGQPVGDTQAWSMFASEDEIVVKPAGAVSTKTAGVTDLSMTSDACGNGRSSVVVEGPAATSVASMTFCQGYVDESGTWACHDVCADGSPLNDDGVCSDSEDGVFHSDDPALATARVQRTRYVSKGFSGELDALLGEGDPEADLTIYALAVDEDGQTSVLGKSSVRRGDAGDALLTDWDELLDQEVELLQENPLYLFGTVIGLNTTKDSPDESVDALLDDAEAGSVTNDNPLFVDQEGTQTNTLGSL